MSRQSYLIGAWQIPCFKPGAEIDCCSTCRCMQGQLLRFSARSRKAFSLSKAYQFFPFLISSMLKDRMIGPYIIIAMQCRAHLTISPPRCMTVPLSMHAPCNASRLHFSTGCIPHCAFRRTRAVCLIFGYHKSYPMTRLSAYLSNYTRYDCASGLREPDGLNHWNQEEMPGRP